MYGILLSAMATAISEFVFKSLLLKTALFSIMFFIASEFITYVTGCGCLPQAEAIQRALTYIPPSVWYFLNLMGFQIGVTAIFCAYVVRFLIRRIPLFG